MSEIKLKPIEELVDIYNNQRIPLSSIKRDKLEKIYPYYGAQGIVDYVDKFIFDGEYMLVAEDGENLKSNNQNICNLVNGKFWVNNHAHILQANENNVTKYIYYRFNLINFAPYVTGSAQPKLNKQNLLGIKLFIHNNKIIQQKIASVLSVLDTKIELNNKINDNLEQQVKLLYDYWFVQFEFPNEDGKPYKSSGGKMVYNKQLKREIPESWEVNTIGSWLDNDKTGDWGKESREGNYVLKVSCIRGADINGINGKGEVNCPERYILEKNSFKVLGNNDIVIEISGGSPTQSTGRMTYITQEVQERFSNPLICSNFCKVVSLKKTENIYVFSQLWNMLYDNGVFFGFEGKTSGIKNLLFDVLSKSYYTTIPNHEIVSLYNSTCNPIYRMIQNNINENQQLSSLRDWLLPMLMNGQVKVE